jgi:toxin FitB
LKILLDTCVISEVRKSKAHPQVLSKLNAIADDSLFLSVLTVGEISKGIALLPPSKRKQSLSRWLQALETEFADRILPIDTDTARLWGELSAKLQGKGISIPGVDGLLAATALNHGMVFMTCNVRQVEASGVRILDPWSQS